MKQLVLDNATRDQFLDFLYEDFAEVLNRLMRSASAAPQKADIDCVKMDVG